MTEKKTITTFYSLEDNELKGITKDLVGKKMSKKEKIQLKKLKKQKKALKKALREVRDQIRKIEG